MHLNLVYTDPSTKCRFRVVREQISELMLIDIDDANAWPFPIEEEQLKALEYERIDDPYPLPDVPVGSLAAQKRDEAWEVMVPLLDCYRDLFDKKKRNQLIKQRLESTTKSRLYITRTLRRYWQRGMAPNSLAPDYNRCGGKGKPRRDVKQKLGRKRTVTPGEGVPVTDEIAEIFKAVIDGFYLTNPKLPLKAAKDKAIGLYKARYPNAEPSMVPTLAQFRYFYSQNYRPGEAAYKKIPKRVYQKDMRPLLSTSGNMNFGPGARYEIDATIGDIYLVSDQDPNEIIGRPTIYFVKDVFSRMVVGLYIGLENASWVSAMMALANAFTNKQDFCRKYGIEIDLNVWPSIGIPAGIMADRGELLYRQADVLVNRFGIQLSNSRAYRGDDKGICERHFNTTQAEFRPYTPGIVEAENGKKRIGKRYELDATLSPSTFTKLMINLVIYYNNVNPVSGYDFAPDMPASLPATPVSLWQWGIQHRTGKLRVCDEKLTWINLLPYETGTISEVGITFKGLVYTCQEALAEGWFDRIRQTRPETVTIAFDPRRTNTVYLRPDERFDSYWACELSDRSRRYRDVSFLEAGRKLKESRKTEAKARQRAAFEKPDLIENIEKIVAEAKKNNKASQQDLPNSQRLAGIKDNRSKAKENERSQHKSDKHVHRKKPADVVTLKPKEAPEESLDYPSLIPFLEDDDD